MLISSLVLIERKNLSLIPNFEGVKVNQGRGKFLEIWDLQLVSLGIKDEESYFEIQ